MADKQTQEQTQEQAFTKAELTASQKHHLELIGANQVGRAAKTPEYAEAARSVAQMARDGQSLKDKAITAGKSIGAGVAGYFGAKHLLEPAGKAVWGWITG